MKYLKKINFQTTQKIILFKNKLPESDYPGLSGELDRNWKKVLKDLSIEEKEELDQTDKKYTELIFQLQTEVLDVAKGVHTMQSQEDLKEYSREILEKIKTIPSSFLDSTPLFAKKLKIIKEQLTNLKL